MAFKDSIIGNNNRPPQTQSSPNAAKTNNIKPKNRRVENIIKYTVVTAFGLYAFWAFLNNTGALGRKEPDQNSTKITQTEQTNSQPQNGHKAEQKIPTQTKVATPPNQQISTSDNKLAQQADTNTSQATQQVSASDWNKKIQALFLNQPRILLNKEKPIIEINNLDLFSKDRDIDLVGYNAVIKPAYFSVTNNDIIINIEIANKTDSAIYVQKTFSLRNSGFNPTYYEDCIIFGNEVYIAGDKLLFFEVKSIEKNRGMVKTILSYNGQNLIIDKEIQ